MFKRIITLALVLITTILTTSCAYMIPEASPDKYRDVYYGYDEESDIYYLEYQNARYYSFDDINDILMSVYFDSQEKKDDFINLGWHYNFPFTTYKEYYSYTAENPDYIFTTGPDRSIYFKEYFDYTKECFVVENIEIEFSEAFTGETINVENKHIKSQSFRWYSKKYSGLYTVANVFFLENKAYLLIYGMDDDNAFQLSDDFLELLIDNGIISYE